MTVGVHWLIPKYTHGYVMCYLFFVIFGLRKMDASGAGYQRSLNVFVLCLLLAFFDQKLVYYAAEGASCSSVCCSCSIKALFKLTCARITADHR